MKKFLIVFLAIISVLAIAVSAIIFVPKVVNEFKVKQLASGGVKVGKTSASLNDSYNGTIDINDDHIEICLTDIKNKNDYVLEKDHLYIIGNYSVDSSNNIIVNVEECYSVLELVGNDNDIDDYLNIKTKASKKELELETITQEEYDRNIARINGEKLYNNEGLIMTFAKLRIDNEENKFYIISYGNDEYTVDFSYYESGELKSITQKKGIIPFTIIEYDTKGNKLNNNSKKEFYDDGVIKKEIMSDNEVYEYDTNGRLVKYFNGRMTTSEYFYNTDGVCVLIKTLTDRGNYSTYCETKIIGYRHEIYVYYEMPENTRIQNSQEIYGNHTIKLSHYFYKDDGTLLEISEDNYNEDGSINSRVRYDANGKMTYKAIYQNGEEISYEYF